MRVVRFFRDRRAAATAIMAIVIAIMVLGAGAFITDHVSLVDQRDTMKAASDAAAIAATLEMRQTLVDNPDIKDAELVAVLKPIAKAYVRANLLHLSESRLKRATDSLVVTITVNRDEATVDVTAQADLGGFIVSSALPFLSGVQQVDAMRTKARAKSATNPIEVVLAIDISGSMNRTLTGKGSGASRMSIVKQAARNLVGILKPSADSKVAVGVVPWHFLVRLDETAAAAWERQGWAAYPSSRRYGATYGCKTLPECTAGDDTQSLPDDPGEEWGGCLDEHRLSAAKVADLPDSEDLLDLPKDSAFAQAIFPSLGGVSYECLQPPLPANLDYQACYGTETVKLRKVYGGRPPPAGVPRRRLR